MFSGRCDTLAALPPMDPSSISLGYGSALWRLEQQLDARSWRAANWLWARWQSRRRRSFIRPGLTLTNVVAAGALPVEQLVDALAGALDGGAFESACALGDSLLAELPTLSGEIAQRGRELVVEALLVAGDRARATRLARAHEGGLRGTSRGVSLLELLGLGDGAVWLPDGRPNLLGLSRRIAEGSLGADELALKIGRKPRVWLQSPQLCLLFFMALRADDPERALGFFNRFLARQSLPRCHARRDPQPTSNLLADLEFEPLPKHREGPLVSVLMAARNAAATIGYAVDSVLGQSYPWLEILVCDDASEDDTLAILQRRYASEPRVRLFRSAANQGAYNIRNALAARACGEFLTFHDADDLALPSRIAAQLEPLRSAQVVVSVTSWMRVTPQGELVFFKNQKAIRLSLVSMMIRRKAWDQVGPFRSARIGADLELFADLRARFGALGVARIRAPQILGLWSQSSATRSAGMEALEDGYRSPARRLYSELVFRKGQHGADGVSDVEIDARLRVSGNYLQASPVLELHDRALA